MYIHVVCNKFNYIVTILLFLYMYMYVHHTMHMYMYVCGQLAHKEVSTMETHTVPLPKSPGLLGMVKPKHSGLAQLQQVS